MVRYVGLTFVLCLFAFGGTFAQDLGPNIRARPTTPAPTACTKAGSFTSGRTPTEEVTWEDGLDINRGGRLRRLLGREPHRRTPRRSVFIVHKGDEKDPGPDMFLMLDEMGNESLADFGERHDLYGETRKARARPKAT